MCGKLPGAVAVRGSGVVFADVFRVFDFDDYGGAAGPRGGGLAEDFLFGLGPVVEVVAGDFPVAEVDFFGAAADGLVVLVEGCGPGVGSFGRIHG